MALDQDIAWRVFTKDISREQALAGTVIPGDESLGLKALGTVSIIAWPCSSAGGHYVKNRYHYGH